ncbi:hypothetical protein ACPEF7_01605, partial [Klebsiella sp. K769]
MSSVTRRPVYSGVTMSEAKLFSPLKVGAVTVPNRVFMAP